MDGGEDIYVFVVRASIADLQESLGRKPADGIGMILYLMLGTFLSVLVEWFHSSKRQVEQHARELHQQREWFRVTLLSIVGALIATDPDG
jgi:hypothetical protein